ncbi:MAG: cofactor-independent phosphoglycerate mutase [Candidatus Omnitrophica bacterium]|nr:cofactor-independent phosphoglycerate mutase [Candidatus Omnitrophota bacterium]
MKLAVVVPDGLADFPVKVLGGKTPLEAAKLPNLHALAGRSILGTVCTVPAGMYPGSDICCLNLFGYDPKQYYTGRAPLEAANLGLVLKPGEFALRCNLVTADGHVLKDYSAGHVSTEEAEILIREIQKHLGSDRFGFYPGKQYRHILICKTDGPLEVEMDAPHDFQGQSYERHWPRGRDAQMFIELTQKSREILEHHAVNHKRARAGKGKANMIWLWGGGAAPVIETLQQKYGIRGGVISAVDLLNGLGRYLDMEIITVPGATGYFDTDYRAKGEAAVKAIDRLDLIFVHVEATDEAGHSGLVDEKVNAIEQIDEHIVGPVLQRLQKEPEWRMFVSPDHYTPLEKKTHVAEPVPFIFAGHDVRQGSGLPYTEKTARSTGVRIEKGNELMESLVHGWRF